MRMICGVLLWLILMEASKGLAVETQSEHHHQLDKECGVYTYHTVKPMLEYFYLVNPKIDKNDAELEEKNNRIKELEEKVNELQMEITIQKSYSDTMVSVLAMLQQQEIKLDTLSNNLCEKQNNEILELKANAIADSEKCVKCEKALESQKDLFASKDRKILELETKLKRSIDETLDIENMNIETCLSDTLSGVYTITLQNDFTFEILSNSDIAGPGWIVIQQRIKGGVDFYRDWEDYKNGFGDFWDGDFFLGLEKIHRLTNEEPFELYIHMQNYDGTINFARYEEFGIASEDDRYRLNNLGGFSGNTTDQFIYHKDMRFSVSDICAIKHHGGWWYNNCVHSNLNGKFFPNGTWAVDGIFWGDWIALKEVRMMIRTKSDCL